MHLNKRPTINCSVFKASAKAQLPSEANCLSQLSRVHQLKDSEEKYDVYSLNHKMELLRNNEGLAGPLKLGMELHLARQVGRLPFLESSNLMEDIILGRDEQISFVDVFGEETAQEHFRHPHAVMEKALGIL